MTNTEIPMTEGVTVETMHETRSDTARRYLKLTGAPDLKLSDWNKRAFRVAPFRVELDWTFGKLERVAVLGLAYRPDGAVGAREVRTVWRRSEGTLAEWASPTGEDLPIWLALIIAKHHDDVPGFPFGGRYCLRADGRHLRHTDADSSECVTPVESARAAVECTCSRRLVLHSPTCALA